MFDDLKMFSRYAWGLNGFFRNALTPEQCQQMILRQLENRKLRFLQIMEMAIYSNPRSPYFKLLRHAGIEYGDVLSLVRQDGVEGTLEQLYDSGVYITIDEFKRRTPIRRQGLEFAVDTHDFDNPFLTRHYNSRTSGSRGGGMRVIIDLDLLMHEAAYYHYFLKAFNLDERPIGIWREVPPVTVGMNVLLRFAKLGKQVERWFTPSRLTISLKTLRYVIFTYYSVYYSRLVSRALPKPAYASLENALHVASWLATKKAEGAPAVVDTFASGGVRICLAAMEYGLDISGTFFCLGGEPYTKAKAQMFCDTGSQAVSRYSMAEIGVIGIACADPTDVDDVHLLTDKIAVIERKKLLGAGDMSVDALVYTTVLPSCPKLMLNVESDDYGVLEDRKCSCPIGELGLTKHLSTIRSYEKLTSGGVTFLGTELLRLVEEVFPARFGGYPTDYQLVEEEEKGLTKVNIIASPRVGSLSEEAIVNTVFEVLHSYPGGDVMSEVWRQGQTLGLVRREPYKTISAKILPLHLLKKTDSS